MSKNLSIVIFSLCISAAGGAFASGGSTEGKTVLLPATPKEDRERCLAQMKRLPHWSSSFQEEAQKAAVSEKPLLIAFMGSDWCPWSQKLEEDVLTQADFLKEIKEKFHLVWLDFPENLQGASINAEVAALKEKFKIEEFPSLILLNPSLEAISKVGYLPLSAQEFARHLKQILQNDQEVREVMQKRDLCTLTSDELQDLYKKVEIINSATYRDKILQAGLQVDKGTFFLLQNYAQFLKEGKKKDAQALDFREKIIERDPKNLNGSLFQLAVLDFETRAKRLKKKANPQSAIRPLLEFVQQFGSKDKENGWKAEMMMAQFLFTKNRAKEALEHAKASYISAPDNVKGEIAQSIDFLKSHAR